MKFKYGNQHKLNRPYYYDDCKRIKNVLENNGIDITLTEAEEMWDEYSDSFCASWMILPENDEDIYKALIEE